jgi:hypothetical protein
MEQAGLFLQRQQNAVLEPRQLSTQFLEALKHNLALFAEVFQQEVTPLAAVGYQEALKDLSTEELNRGCALALRECKFMPRPAEIIERSKPRGEARDVLIGATYEDCPNCRGTGWRVVPKIGGGEHARLCECRRKSA